MFAIDTSKKLTSVTTTIIQNIELSALLYGSYKATGILLCPTQAISVLDNAIDVDRCIACGICKKLIPDVVKYSREEGEALRFIEYCKTHKMFVYRWLCLSSAGISGTEVFVKGFSRSKRIPFVSLGDNFLRFVKCAYNVRELEKAKAELNDMATLASNVAEALSIEKSIVLIQGPSNQRERQYVDRLSGYTLFDLAGLHRTFIETFNDSVSR